MKRRTWITALLAGAAGLARGANTIASKPIELHVDLDVARGREKEMLASFRDVFRPAAMKQPGYMNAKMLRLDHAVAGRAPEGCNYRFVLRFQSEELRQKWVASDAHKRAWPEIEKTLASKSYNAVLFDEGHE